MSTKRWHTNAHISFISSGRWSNSTQNLTSIRWSIWLWSQFLFFLHFFVASVRVNVLPDVWLFRFECYWFCWTRQTGNGNKLNFNCKRRMFTWMHDIWNRMHDNGSHLFCETTARRLNMTTKSSKFEDRTNQMHAHVNTRTITALLYMRTTYNDFIKRSSHTKEPHRNTHSYHFCTDCVRERERNCKGWNEMTNWMALTLFSVWAWSSRMFEHEKWMWAMKKREKNTQKKSITMKYPYW